MNLEKQNFANRFLVPIAAALAVMAISALSYRLSVRIDGRILGIVMASIFGTIYFASVALSAIPVYATSFIRGASFAERIIASAIAPLAWAIKECVRLLESHPPLECLYWFLNPLNLWLGLLMITEMGIATLIAKSLLHGRGVETKGSMAAPAIAIALSLAAVIGVYSWGHGENVYVLFLKGYRLFFGAGISISQGMGR